MKYIFLINYIKTLKFSLYLQLKGRMTIKYYAILKMLRAIVVFAPIVAAVAWVVFNIQKPAREQFNRDILGKKD